MPQELHEVRLHQMRNLNSEQREVAFEVTVLLLSLEIVSQQFLEMREQLARGLELQMPLHRQCIEEL